ncbi:hypothetical protein HDV05_001338 [Chytridiales sp. JEL 0842]|nr:hypothetical protein HDV05_001338 [Chytridiales sp. JEL 0842]
MLATTTTPTTPSMDTPTTSSNPPRGALIVIEGVDRSGKTTQCQKLIESLHSHSHPCKLVKFPNRTTPTGLLIHSYLQSTTHMDDRTIHQLFAVNRSEAMQTLQQDLEKGLTVVVDRYAYSGVAYTAAKENPLLPLEWCKAQDSGILKPDLVLFLDVPPEDARGREAYGEERYEKLEFQQRVRRVFLEDMRGEGCVWEVLDARQSIEALAEQVLSHAQKAIARSRTEPLGTLWPLS